MREEELLRLSGDSLREPDRLDDPRLDALARGELSDAEVAQLLELERAGQMPEGTVEAFAPLSEDFLLRLEQRLEKTQGVSDQTNAGVEHDAKVVSIDRARRKRSRIFLIGTPMAAAAAALLALALWPMGPGGATLPGYSLEVDGGLATFRSVEVHSQGPLRLSRSTGAELRLRPDTRTEEKVVVRLLSVDEGTAKPRIIDPAFDVSSSGTVTVALSAEQVAGDAPGNKRVYVVIAPLAMKDSLPRTEAEMSSLPKQVHSFILPVIVEK